MDDIKTSSFSNYGARVQNALVQKPVEAKVFAWPQTPLCLSLLIVSEGYIPRPLGRLLRVWTPRKIPYLNNIPRPLGAGLLIFFVSPVSSVCLRASV